MNTRIKSIVAVVLTLVLAISPLTQETVTYANTTAKSVSANTAKKYKVTKIKPKTLYAKRALNIRKGPSVKDYKKVGVIKANQKVTVVGVVKVYKGETVLWYKLKDNKGYVHGGYLTDRDPSKQKTSSSSSKKATTASNKTSSGSGKASSGSSKATTGSKKTETTKNAVSQSSGKKNDKVKENDRLLEEAGLSQETLEYLDGLFEGGTFE